MIGKVSNLEDENYKDLISQLSGYLAFHWLNSNSCADKDLLTFYARPLLCGLSGDTMTGVISV